MAVGRYHRQELLGQIGRAGQERLRAAKVLLVGCGALGSVIADYLVRAGVGELRVADRDIVEMTNLQRQVLFEEEDARRGVPKAVAAKERLSRVNSEVRVEALAVDVHGGNIEEMVKSEIRSTKSETNPKFEIRNGGGGVDLILDGTDNVETRYLVNDVAVKWGIPWVYGACVGWEGRVMGVRAGEGACLRCVYPERPRGGELATCDTAGVLGPAAGVVASMQAVVAIKMLTGNGGAVGGELLTLDLWGNRIRSVGVERDPGCPCCGRGEFPFLAERAGDGAVSLCGRDAVQVRGGKALDLDAVAGKLGAVGGVERSRYFVRADVGEGIVLTVFPDGRMIAGGTRDGGRARALYAKYVGA